MIKFPKTAVLFKAHFWDEFVDRQFRRLLAKSKNSDIFVVIDETKSKIKDIPHHNVIRMNEKISELEGYLLYPKGNLFWYNTDYQIYHFMDTYPDYDYILICEYDCVVNVDVEIFFEAMAALNLDFVGERIRTPAAEWPWTATAKPYYDDEVEISGRLLCFAIFTRRLARHLQSARRNLTARSVDYGGVVWPNNEAFVGAEIARMSVSEASLSAFGNASHYDWAPPHLECELKKLSHCIVVHPVLSLQRYVESIRKLNWSLGAQFYQGSHLQNCLDDYEISEVVSVLLEQFLDTEDWSAIDRLRSYAESRAYQNMAILDTVGRPPHLETL